MPRFSETHWIKSRNHTVGAISAQLWNLNLTKARFIEDGHLIFNPSPAAPLHIHNGYKLIQTHDNRIQSKEFQVKNNINMKREFKCQIWRELVLHLSQTSFYTFSIHEHKTAAK